MRLEQRAGDVVQPRRDRYVEWRTRVGIARVHVGTVLQEHAHQCESPRRRHTRCHRPSATAAAAAIRLVVVVVVVVVCELLEVLES